MMSEADDDTTRDPLSRFFEALLSLEWPDRRIAVTRAPLPDLLTHVTKTGAMTVALVVGAFDVTIGPLSDPTKDDDSWASFSITVGSRLRRHDWLGAGALLLTRAEEEMMLWPERKRAREARGRI